MANSPAHIIIIGDGFSAGEAMYCLVTQMRRVGKMPVPVTIEVIGAASREKFWLGLAWDKDLIIPHLHRTNTYVRHESETIEYGECSRADFMEPILQIYEQHIREHAQEIAGVRVSITPNTTVTDVKRSGQRFEVIDASGKKRIADYVILATGHWQGRRASEHKGIYASPWPARKVQEGITPGQDVAVLGTGLSGADSILAAAEKLLGETKNTAAAKERGGSVTAYSPHGILPSVLGIVKVIKADEAMNRFIEGSMVTLDAAYKEFRRMFFVMLDGLSYVDATHQQIRKTLESCEHVEEAVAAFYAYYDSIGHAGWLRQGIVAADKGLQTRETIAWQTYIVSASRLVEAAYSRLSGEEKEHFNRVVRPLYIKLSNGMSIKNAQQLLVLLESGFLRVTALGEHFSVTPRDTGGAIVSYRDRTGQEHRAEHPVVIRATGEDMRDIRDSSPLMENLFAAGMVRESFTLYDDQAVAKARFEAQLPGRQESIRYIDGYYYYVQGGLDFDLRTCEVNAMSPEHPSTNLFAIGVPLYQRSLLLHGVKPIKIHAIIIADRITGRIVRNLNPLQVEVGNAFMGSTKLADGTTIALTRRPVSSKAREMIATNLNIPKENIFTSGGLPPETLRLLVPSLQGQAASAL